MVVRVPHLIPFPVDKLHLHHIMPVRSVLDEPGKISSIISTDSVNELDLKPGDKIHILIKAIHVIPAVD